MMLLPKSRALIVCIRIGVTFIVMAYGVMSAPKGSTLMIWIATTMSDQVPRIWGTFLFHER